MFVHAANLGEFEAEFKNALARESGDQGVMFGEKKPRVENLVTLSLYLLRYRSTVSDRGDG
jgi:hypothetical protein